jgi:hypothetical protein
MLSGPGICPVTSLPAADVKGAVLDHIQRLLAAPELVARTWATAKREDEITEREVTVLLAEQSCSRPNRRASSSCSSSGRREGGGA